MTASPLSREARALIDVANEHEPLPSSAALRQLRRGVAKRAAMAGGATVLGLSTTAKAGLPLRLLLYGLAGTGAGVGVLASGHILHTALQPHGLAAPQSREATRTAASGRAPSASRTPARRSEPTVPPAMAVPASPVHDDHAVANAKLAAPDVSRTPVASGTLRAPGNAPATPELGLARQLEVMQNVRALLRARQSERVLDVLERHRELFGKTPLEEEYRVARILALCELGRRDDARTAADEFFARWPGSPYRAQVQEACRP